MKTVNIVRNPKAPHIRLSENCPTASSDAKHSPSQTPPKLRPNVPLPRARALQQTLPPLILQLSQSTLQVSHNLIKLLIYTSPPPNLNLQRLNLPAQTMHCTFLTFTERALRLAVLRPAALNGCLWQVSIWFEESERVWGRGVGLGWVGSGQGVGSRGRGG